MKFSNNYERKEGFTIGELLEVLQGHDSAKKPRVRTTIAFNAAGGYITRITITEEEEPHGNQSQNS